MNDVIEHFAGDLRASGVDELGVVRTAQLYGRALVTGSDFAWRQFYRATFVALTRSAERALPRSLAAVESLLRLLDDDLGRTLFDAGTVAQLDARLCGRLSASSPG